MYRASKAGLHSWSQSLRIQLAPTNVAVIEALLPTVDTDMATHFDVKKVSPASVADAIVDAVITGREEIRFGQGRALYRMSRLAPGFILRQLNRTPIELEHHKDLAL